MNKVEVLEAVLLALRKLVRKTQLELSAARADASRESIAALRAEGEQ